jgi:SAM-dependent methyltransferase
MRADLSLHSCRNCGFVSGLPSQVLSVSEQYAHYYNGAAPPAPDARYHDWLSRVERTVGVGRLVEVGAGRAGFVRVALARGWAVSATEVSLSGLEELRRTRAHVFAGDVTEANYPDGCFDLVVSLEVVEHLPSPMQHLREFYRITRPGGLLLLTTPNLQGLSGRSLGMRWRVVTPEHLGYFCPRTLRRALEHVGYRHVRVGSRSLDVSTWRASTRSATPRFDPNASAALRDAVEGSPVLRWSKEAVNAVLRATGLGDSLLAWGRR